MKKNVILALLFSSVSCLSMAQFWSVSDPVQIGGTVNTLDGEESIPVFSKDSSILYFVRTYDKKNKGGMADQDIWYSTRNSDGTYSDCKRLKHLNNKFNNAVLGLSSNGSSMYLLDAYEGKKDLVKGLAVSTGSGTGWSSPEKISIPALDIEGDFYGFHVSKDGQTIIISQNGPNSFGEEDLYVSEKTGNSWSTPLHLGNVINSTGFEISPFLSDSKDTLFFSSNGMGGEGDADIFYSVKNGSWTDWSLPVNLGAPINSMRFDAYFTYSGDQVFWSSNRDNVRSDIYTASILAPPPLVASARGSDVTVFGGSDGKVDCTPKGGMAPYSYLWSNGIKTQDMSGLPKGEYSVIVTDKVGQVAEVTVMIGEPKPAVVSIPKDYNYDMTHYFGYNADKLDNDNEKVQRFLSGVEEQVSTGKDITIRIRSSASYVPTREFKSNKDLAKSRGEKIKKMLEEYCMKNNLSSKVTVVLKEVMVQGPLYENDRDDVEKYRPFQFIDLSTRTAE